jgi:hypothetical protein
MKILPQPWTAAMEVAIFTGWIYDHLLPHAAALKAAHPLMLRAIAAAKKKNDRIDAHKIADCLRCDSSIPLFGASRDALRPSCATNCEHSSDVRCCYRNYRNTLVLAAQRGSRRDRRDTLLRAMLHRTATRRPAENRSP